MAPSGGWVSLMQRTSCAFSCLPHKIAAVPKKNSAIYYSEQPLNTQCAFVKAERSIRLLKGGKRSILRSPAPLLRRQLYNGADKNLHVLHQTIHGHIFTGLMSQLLVIREQCAKGNAFL